MRKPSVHLITLLLASLLLLGLLSLTVIAGVTVIEPASLDIPALLDGINAACGEHCVDVGELPEADLLVIMTSKFPGGQPTIGFARPTSARIF